MRGILPIMAYTGRLHRNEVPFSGFRYKKGYGFHLLKYVKEYGNLSSRSVKIPKRLTCILWLRKSFVNYSFIQSNLH